MAIGINFNDYPHWTKSQNERDRLLFKYKDKIIINKDLTRPLVSFQSNKQIPFHRWLKYKEAFSHDFVKYIINTFRPKGKSSPKILDPFAGSGTSLATSVLEGWNATGIELMPVGISIIKAKIVSDSVDKELFDLHINKLRSFSLDESEVEKYRFPHLRITKMAFPPNTERQLAAFGKFLQKIRDENVRQLFDFAALSVLEDISYTRKDGQYLRWDERSGRNLKSTFNKGKIHPFKEAILEKLLTMSCDLLHRNQSTFSKKINIIEGSCLDQLSELPEESFDLILTSPPYCNRYDYTRTYALELAYLRYNEEEVSRLRQTLLSATVENKAKKDYLRHTYGQKGKTNFFNTLESTFNHCAALSEVLSALYDAKEKKLLNNANIPNMVENYFYEMNVVIHEMARVLKKGGHVVLVNDNVQYHGEEVPVDLILSDFAHSAGLNVDSIWVLPRGKGNSSQQMGAHGRRELRKCVYIWSKR